CGETIVSKTAQESGYLSDFSRTAVGLGSVAGVGSTKLDQACMAGAIESDWCPAARVLRHVD
ncbi:MAG: hypothetical protein EA353_12625, partial [Puniceicoccaceae bacterium]